MNGRYLIRGASVMTASSAANTSALSTAESAASIMTRPRPRQLLGAALVLAPLSSCGGGGTAAPTAGATAPDALGASGTDAAPGGDLPREPSYEYDDGALDAAASNVRAPDGDDAD